MATPTQIADLLLEIVEGGLIPTYDDDLRDAAAKLREMEEALNAAKPLASSLNYYASINDEMGRVVDGQAQKARDLFAIIDRALQSSPQKD